MATANATGRLVGDAAPLEVIWRGADEVGEGDVVGRGDVVGAGGAVVGAGTVVRRVVGALVTVGGGGGVYVEVCGTGTVE